MIVATPDMSRDKLPYFGEPDESGTKSTLSSLLQRSNHKYGPSREIHERKQISVHRHCYIFGFLHSQVCPGMRHPLRSSFIPLHDQINHFQISFHKHWQSPGEMMKECVGARGLV